MLSSKGIKAGDAGEMAAYYEGLAGEDYYTNGGEPPGRWIGAGAERLGLDGEVKKGELRAAFHGYHPRTGEAIAARLGDAHKPGEDLTFSAPKSVSMIWAAGDAETQKAISAAQQRAVEAAIKHAENSGAFRTQHGARGVAKQAYDGGLAVATFEHSTSREGDPQLHTHAIVMNLSDSGRNIDFDAKTKTLLGGAYRAGLASELQKLGFAIERDKSSFRIAEVPRELEKDFSTRRKQIEAELKQQGMSGGKAAQVATMATREAKGEVNRAELFENAKQVAATYGLDADKISSMRNSFHENEPKSMPTHEEMAAQLTQQASTVTEHQLEAACYQEAQGITNIEEATKYIEALKNSEHIIELRDSDGNTRYTSKEMFEIEQRIAERAGVMANEFTHPVRVSTVENVIADFREKAQAAGKGNGLSDEQRAALVHVMGAERLAVIEGTAGAGKSYMLDAARDAWQRDGYTVRGCALAGKAAEGLEKSSNIESTTIHSTLAQLDSGKLTLDSKTVIVVDEAGMCDSRLMSRLQDHIDVAGGKLVLVGDTKQLQPVDAGGAMRAQREAAGKYAEMNEIRRQKDDAEKAMVHDAKAGRSERVVSYLEERGRLHQHETRADVVKAMAAATVDDLKSGKTSLALAESKAEVRLINEEAREMAKAAGLVTGEDRVFTTERGDRQFAAGDRVIFLKNDGDLGVKNGTTGTVQQSADGRLTVQIDESDRKVDVQQDKYAHIDHGYGMTVHKSQGVTVDRAHYAPGGMAHAELAYVALSRQRETVEMHVTKEQREALAKQLAESKAKGSSTDYARTEKHQAAIDKAEKNIAAAQEQIAKLEAQRAKLISAAPDNNKQSQLNQHQENPNARPDRYADRPAQRYEPLPGRAADAAHQAPARAVPAESIDKLRNLSERNVVSSARRLDQVPLQSTKRDHLASQGKESDHRVRRAGDRANASSSERGLTAKELASQQKQLAKLDKQLANARADLASATKVRDSALARQQEAKAQPATTPEAAKERIKELNKRIDDLTKRIDDLTKSRPSASEREQGRIDEKIYAVQVQKDQAEKALEAAEKHLQQAKVAERASVRPVQAHDARLAKAALEAHSRGDKLPAGKALEKAIKSGEIRPVKDSAGRQYFENTKTGAVHSKALNQQPKRETTSMNLQHLGLTSTKYKVVDKKLLGMTVGSTVLKSGGTLRKEAAGALRDKLHTATKGNETAKALAKPLDNVLQKAEGWQKAGAIESLAARVQMKLEQKAAERAAVRELQSVVKAAEKPKAAEKTIEKPAEKTQERTTTLSATPDKGDDIAKRAERLAAREAPERAPEKAPEKSNDKGGYDR